MYIFTLLITGSSHRSHSPVSAARAINLPVQQDGEGSSVSPPGLNMETLQQQKHSVQVAHTASERVCRHTEAIHFTAHAETCRHLLTKSPVPTLISYRPSLPRELSLEFCECCWCSCFEMRRGFAGTTAPVQREVLCSPWEEAAAPWRRENCSLLIGC